MFCFNCGKKIEDNAKFCPYCGNDLKETEDVDTQTESTTFVEEKTEKAQKKPEEHRLIRKRSIWKFLLFSIITCGIYSIYAMYKFTEDMNSLCEGDGKESPNYIIVLLLTLCTLGIYGFYWWYRQAERLKEAACRYGLEIRESGRSILCWQIFGSLLFNLGPFVSIYIMFDNMNYIALIYNGEKSREEVRAMGTPHAKLVRNVWCIAGGILGVLLLLIALGVGSIFILMSDSEDKEEEYQKIEKQVNEKNMDGLTNDTLESQVIPEEEESKVENEQEEKEKNTEPVTDTSLGWKKAYLDYLNGIGNTEYGYSLDYIDGDDIPELVIDYMNAAEGVTLCTYDGIGVVETPVGESLRYRLKENLFCVSGGRMDHYYDIVYKIVDGVPKEVSKGEYGVLDYENVKYDESGLMIYQYSWNGESVSEYDYYNRIENFSYEKYPNIVCPAGNGYFYDIIEVLEHPLDIVTIKPYLNDNGYTNLLNNYVVLFDGIEGDKIHFSVTYDGELVGSASATIIDSKTAEYKNAKSELVIKFDADYKQLEIEGYMDTIDLTGSYVGIWG